MKILHVIASVNAAGGGMSEVVPRLCRALQDSGHEVVLLAIEADTVSTQTDEAIRAGVRYVDYPMLPYVRALALAPLLRNELVKWVAWADIVHVHGLWQAPCWYPAAECLRQHKPYVMMPHGFLEPARLRISKWKKRIVGGLFDRRYLMSANGLVATSPSEEVGFRRYGLTNPVHVMPIGLDLNVFPLAHFHTKTKERKRKKRLLYFSRVTPVKGLDMLAEAWAALSDLHNTWELVITGPDDRGYSNVIRGEFERLSPDDSVRFTGPVYGDSKVSALQSADAFVLPTRSENWSIAVAEAMAFGLPVVCTKGAPWSCLNTYKAGLWVDISVSAIACGLRQIMSADDIARQVMGLRGRQWVATNLDWSKIVDKMVFFYMTLR